MKKVLKIASIILCLVLCLSVAFACDGNKDNGGNGNIWEDGEGDTDVPGGAEAKNFVMEVEYVDYTGLDGAGCSESALETNMIKKDTLSLGASNGYYTPFTNTPDLTFTFNFVSDKATTAKIVLRLSSQLGTLAFSKDDFAVILNGTSINYGTFTVNGADDNKTAPFQNFTATKSATILEGNNVIELVILENELFPGEGNTAGPIIDCLRLTSDANLTWMPKTSNLNGK